VTFQKLLKVGLQKIFGHCKAAAGVQHLFRQKEAIFAIEIADGTTRLDQNVECGRRIFWKR
jgi:hypothetical protein